MKDVLNVLDTVLKGAKDTVLEKGLNSLDIVSREDFEIQKKILIKTRTKVEELEAKLDKLLSEKES